MNHLIEKLNNNRRLLSLGKNLLDSTCLKNVYYGHIHSHLIYGNAAWGSMASAAHLKEIKKIQNQSVRIISDSNTDQNKVHKIVKLEDITKSSLCKLGHLITHNLLPSPILNIFNNYGGKKKHHYSTRNRDTPNIQWHQDVKFNKSFLCQNILEYSKLPMSLRQEKKLNKFNKLLKLHILGI